MNSWAQNPNTPIIKDWFILGLTTGMACAVVKSAINFIASKAGIPTVQYRVIAGNMVLGKRDQKRWRFLRPHANRQERLVGGLADAVFGGILGVVTSFVYSKTPPGNELVKGALGGAAIWAATFTIPNQMHVSQLKPSEMITLLGMDVCFGAMQGALIGRYGTKLISQSHPLLVKQVTSRSFERARLTTRATRGRSQALM